MAEQDLISHYIDPVTFEGDTKFAVQQLEKLEAAYNKLNSLRINLRDPNNKNIVGDIQAANTSIKDLSNTITAQTAAVNQNIAAARNLKVELLELKKRNLELTIAAKEKLAADKEALKASKDASAQEKKNSADAVAASREKILALREEQAAIEKAAEAENQRSVAEQQHLSGTYNPGGGKGKTAPVNEPLNLSVDQGNILLLKQYEAEIAKLALEQKNAAAAFKNGEISQNAYKQVVVDNTQKIIGYKNNVSDLNKEMKLSADVNDAERNSLARAQALIAQYTFEKKKLNLATEEGRLLNENYNKAIAASNAFILKNADAETVRTKSVGKYTEGIQKAFSGLRTLANILPGIGLSGLFLLGFEAIQKAVQALGLFNNSLLTAAKQKEILTKLDDDAAKSAGKEAGELTILRAEIESSIVPMGTRLQAIKDIKKEYPDYFAGLTNEQILTGNVGNAYDLAAAAILRKARAQAAAKQIEDLSAKQIAIEIKSNEDLTQTYKDIQNAKTQVTTNAAIGDVGSVGKSKDFIQQDLLDQAKAREDDRQKELAGLKKQQDFLLKFAVDGAKETVKIEKVKNDTVRESTKTLLDSDFELYKADQLRKIKVLEEGFSNDKLSYDKRISLLNQYSTERGILIDAQAKEDLRKNLEHENALQENLKKSKGTEKNNLLIEIKNNETARALIEKNASIARLGVFDDNEKAYTDITEKENSRRNKIERDSYNKSIKLIEDEGFERKAVLEQEYEEGTAGLQARYDAGKISQEQYNKKKLDLDFAYAAESLQIAIDTEKKKIAIGLLSFEDQKKALYELAKLERQLQDASVDHTKKTEAEKLATIQKTLSTIKDVSVIVFDFVGGLLNANAIAEKNRLQTQQDTAEKNAALDIDRINASTASEQDKAAKILIINARLQTQKDQIAQKEKQQEVVQAKFAKAVAIFNIILSTTQAVIKAYTEGDPYTKVSRAILAATAGATQLAIAAATPVPRFKQGKFNDYSGLGWVDDGGKNEPIYRAGTGQFEISTGAPKDRLTYLGKQDIVFPDLMEVMKKTAMPNISFNTLNQDIVASNRIEAALQAQVNQLKMHNSLLQKIANKKEQTIGADNNGMIQLMRWGSRQIKYVNDNTNW